MDPVTLHAYSPAAGLPEVKEAIAAYLSERYDTTATPGHLVPDGRCRGGFGFIHCRCDPSG